MLARWMNDPEVRRGLAHRGLVNQDAELKWYEQMTDAGRRPRPTAVAFAVHDAADGEWWGCAESTASITTSRGRGREYEFNEQARRAYERAGFQVMGRRRDAVSVLGRRWDSFLMDAVASEFESPVLGDLRPER
jgi:hypothetical protein